MEEIGNGFFCLVLIPFGGSVYVKKLFEKKGRNSNQLLSFYSEENLIEFIVGEFHF